MKPELMTNHTSVPDSINPTATINWFASWFDTPYYHILYKERNDEEAQLLIQKYDDLQKQTMNASAKNAT